MEEINEENKQTTLFLQLQEVGKWEKILDIGFTSNVVFVTIDVSWVEAIARNKEFILKSQGFRQTSEKLFWSIPMFKTSFKYVYF